MLRMLNSHEEQVALHSSWMCRTQREWSGKRHSEHCFIIIHTKYTWAIRKVQCLTQVFVFDWLVDCPSQNMQVRVLGGKTFCSREGRMVVGQMKDNYILVDLETVIHGSYRYRLHKAGIFPEKLCLCYVMFPYNSYFTLHILSSLTWTDAHLHRHLVTLLSGPVVGSFDREFRILFAASLPVPEVRAAPLTVGDTTHYRMNESSDLWYPNRPLLGPLLSPPPPPPEGTPLDWEALGVFRRKSYPHDSPTDPSVEARRGLHRTLRHSRNSHPSRMIFHGT